MTDSYKEGCREGVIFALVKDKELLIEKRPSKDGVEFFIPNGGIEEKDKKKDEDYRITALKREAKEELNIDILDFEYLMDHKVDEIKIWFYIYLIKKWKGEIPNFTVEPPGSNIKFADLEWIKIKDYKKIFSLPSALKTCEKIIERLNLL